MIASETADLGELGFGLKRRRKKRPPGPRPPPKGKKGDGAPKEAKKEVPATPVETELAPVEPEQAGEEGGGFPWAWVVGGLALAGAAYFFLRRKKS